MRKSLKGKKFTSDIDTEYVKKHNIQFPDRGGNGEHNATELYPIVTEERVKSAIDFLKIIEERKIMNDNISQFNPSKPELGWTAAAPLEMTCEHPLCKSKIGKDYSQGKHEPMFLCDKHALHRFWIVRLFNCRLYMHE